MEILVTLSPTSSSHLVKSTYNDEFESDWPRGAFLVSNFISSTHSSMAFRSQMSSRRDWILESSLEVFFFGTVSTVVWFSSWNGEKHPRIQSDTSNLLIQFSFIYIVPNDKNSQLKVLYIVSWNPKKIQKKIQTIRQPPYKETIGDSGKTKIPFNKARGGAAIYCDLLLNVTHFWTYFSSASSADRSFGFRTKRC